MNTALEQLEHWIEQYKRINGTPPINEILTQIDLLKDYEKEQCNIDLVSQRTEHLDHLERFIVVHKNIQDVPVNDLETEQRKYAKTLGKVMDGKYFVNAYDNEKKKIASINEIISSKDIKYYYSHKTIYGYIAELGSKKIDSERKHVMIDGFAHRIYISGDLDLELKPYYKTQKLSMKIKIRRSFEKGSIVNAEMISFKKVGELSLMENLKNEGFIPLEIMNEKTSLEGLINSIYGY